MDELLQKEKNNKFSKIFQKTTEEIFRNEVAYHDSLLQVEQERARIAYEQAMDAQKQAEDAQKQAESAHEQALLAQQKMEIERKEKEKEHQLRLKIQKEYLLYKISTLLQAGLNEEEICMECHLTENDFREIIKLI